MPEELGRYKILEEIGQGGFAVVYRARDTELDRLVALKELRPALLHDHEWVRRFKREARTIASLDHPGIVTIYDVIEVAERLFIVMRLVDGASLDHLLATQGGLPWSQTLEIIMAVADALTYAHAHGVLHRDLKPANILLDSYQGAQLSDFGLAKIISEASTNVTAGGGVVGTPHYIAPEVWEGEGTTLQSDIYALGCILYEMVTGEKLFRGASPPAVMMAHFSPLALPDTWPEGIPAGINEVLKAALARRPSDRYATVRELRQALTTLVTSRPAEQDQAGQVISPVPRPASIPTGPHIDWGEAPDVSVFYGRQVETAQLTHWLLDEGCRLVGVLLAV
jgi:serine/threonine-protein kinase